MGEGIFVFVCAVLIPFFDWQQRLEGRNFLAMIMTGLLLIYYVLAGITFPSDMTSLMVLCFILWASASMLWTNSRASYIDLYSIFAFLAVFMTARTLPTEILIPLISIPGPIFAAAMIYWRKSPDPKKQFFIFGNRNHIASFLLVYVFVFLWMAFNISPWLGLFLIPILYAIMISSCRGAQLALLCGLFVTACIQQPYYLLSIPFLVVVGFLVVKNTGSEGINSNKDRIIFWLAAMMMIKEHPFGGFGLRSFRREYPNFMPFLLNHRFVKKYLPTTYETTLVERISSHRVHNDHLELIVELGIVGYILFLLIFMSLDFAAQPTLSGLIVAFAVHGLFFFPFREAHTALPFFAAIGAMSPISTILIEINQLVSTVSVFVIIAIMYHIWVKIVGLYYHDLSSKINVTMIASNPEEKRLLATKQALIRSSIEHDQYNCTYLTEGFYYHIGTHPELSFQFASRCLENYDGGKVKWGCFDQYARALLRLGGFAVARMAINNALHICPGFKQAEFLLKQIDALEKGGQPNGVHG